MKIHGLVMIFYDTLGHCNKFDQLLTIRVAGDENVCFSLRECWVQHDGFLPDPWQNGQATVTSSHGLPMEYDTGFLIPLPPQ